MSGRRRNEQQGNIPSATNLPAPASDDQAHRMKQYLVSMGIRTFCFLAGVLLWPVNRWVAGACFVLASILPYIAVVLANAAGRRKIDVLGSVDPGPLPPKEIHGSARNPQHH